MTELDRHSADMDCRGAGYGTQLSNVNKVYITKTYVGGSLVPVAAEVSCSHLRRPTKECSIGSMPCPHLHPVSSAS